MTTESDKDTLSLGSRSNPGTDASKPVCVVSVHAIGALNRQVGEAGIIDGCTAVRSINVPCYAQASPWVQTGTSV